MIRRRIFDHLEGSPDDRYFSRIARQMHGSAWWSSVPVYVAPRPVSGEVES